MNIVCPSSYYNPNFFFGSNVHIKQFIDNAIALGHKVWTPRGIMCSSATPLPAGRLRRLMILRKMDVVYVRVEEKPTKATGWALPPYRQILRSPLMVWEFNTVPEYAKVLGHDDSAIHQAIRLFRQQSKGCDLAICVSKSISEYVYATLGIEHVITIPNGSDPNKFTPHALPVNHVERRIGKLNVVWIGSADLSWHDFNLMTETARFLWNSASREKISFHIIGQHLQGIHEMPPNIHYHGAVQYDRLPHWLAAMDVGLILYHPGPGDYSSPLKLFDYMASGLAVVSSEQPQVKDILSEIGQRDLILPQRNPVVLAKMLLDLAGNPYKVKLCGQAGRQLIIKKYNWRKLVEESFVAIEKKIRETHVRKRFFRS
jgi:glycosyltransferase involved in cell wall biosynthesis